MKFVRKYKVLAILFLFIYGLFILGSVSGGIGVTGNAINFLGENKILLVYVGAGIWGLILLGGLAWLGIKFFKKRKNKKKMS